VTEAGPATRRRQALRVGFGVVVGGAALWATVAAGTGLGAVLDALGRAEPSWVLLAVVAEVFSYAFAASRLRRLAGPDATLGVASGLGVTLVAHGLLLLAPAAPAEGIAFEVRTLRARGLDRRRAGLTVGFEQWFSTRSFYLAHAVNLVVIVATRDFPADARWPVLAATIVLGLLVLTASAAARPRVAERVGVAIGALRFWVPRPPAAERRAAGARFHADAMRVVGSPRRRAGLVAWSVGAVLADAAAFWMLLHATGIHDGFDLALLAVGAGAAAASIPLLPGGIGAVEAAMPALLAWYGAPVAAALAATLLYRAVGTLLPAVAGGASFAVLSAARRGHRPAGP